jgi:hypothetical protein
MKDKFDEKIRSLIEQRVIESTKKRITQKLLMISKYMGRPIISQSVIGDLEESWHRQGDYGLLYDPTKIYDAEDVGEPYDRGYHFDGLKCGINLCITVMVFDNKISELKATYNGYLVFAEMEGELKAYAPFPAWEDAMDMFYEGAVQMEKKKMEQEKAKRQEANKRAFSSYWQKFRMLWGY